MATAGAMNAVSGMGHSIVNAIGNAGSAIAAAADKRALYNNESTSRLLAKAIYSDIIDCYFAHMDFINEIKSDYYDGSFDVDKGEALFENAKKVQSKQKDLLLTSFENYPWNEDLFVFIFQTYKEEQKSIWNIAKRFHIDLSEVAETAFATAYASCDHTSEQDVQCIKQEILSSMHELGIETSDTIVRIEQDGARRILEAYSTANDIERQAMFDKLKGYDASAENKAIVVKELFVWELARDYSVHFSDQEVETIIEGYYNDDAKRAETEALIAKEKIKKVMAALEVQNSKTFDMLEQDGVRRILESYSTADENKRQEMFDKLKDYDALFENKAAVIKELLVWELARDYSVKFSVQEAETIIEAYYTDDAKLTEDKALVAKEKIKRVMTALDIQSSKVFDDLEKDCVARLCLGCEDADEETCNKMLESIREYDALEQNKQESILRIKGRIEEIWSAEDGELFDNVYLNTDIYNAEDVKKSMAFIKEKGRTKSSQKYVDALSNCNDDTIKKAFNYKKESAKNYFWLGWGFAILAILAILLKIGFWGFLASGVLSGIFFAYYFGLKKAWNILTLDGKLIHKAFSEERKVPQARKEDQKKIPVPMLVAVIAALILVMALFSWISPQSYEEVSSDFTKAMLIDFDAKDTVSLVSEELLDHYMNQLGCSSKKEVIRRMEETFEQRKDDTIGYYGKDWKAKIIDVETRSHEGNSATVIVSVSHEGSEALWNTNIDEVWVYLVRENNRWKVCDFQG